MRVVLDANVVVSALITTQGIPQHILSLWRDGAFELVTSEPILLEIERVLRYPKIAERHKLTEAELQEFLTLLRHESQVVAPQTHLHLSADESDNRYIECAVAGDADYLVTGDKKHLISVGGYQGIAILSPAAFLAVVRLDG